MTNPFNEVNTKMDRTGVCVAIFRLREAMKAVSVCGADAGVWIVGDLGLHIEELQEEIGGIEYERHIGSR